MAKNIELYNKTVDILFQEYFKDTLVHGDCAHCVVGNIVLAAGVPYFKPSMKLHANGSFHSGAWKGIFYTDGEMGIQTWGEHDEMFNKDAALKTIEMTGYTVSDLARIEFAFETADKGYSKEDYMFNGLVAVLEVLKLIHEIDDNTDQVERFTAHHKVRVST